MPSIDHTGQARRRAWQRLVWRLALAVLGSLSVGHVVAQSYGVQSFDDDFSALCGQGTLKCVPTGDLGYVSFGGRLREQFLEGRPDDFGLLGSRQVNTTWLHRLLLHADWHLGPGLRLYLELGNHLEAWRPGGPRPTDKDTLDLQQAFADIRFIDNASGQWTWRPGRQQITLGGYRLVAPRENANILIAYDGNLLQWQRRQWTVRAFDFRPVLNHPGYFDDGNDTAQRLSGLYATRRAQAGGPSVDVYWLDYDNQAGKLYKLKGNDHRGSYGVRLFARTRRWDYDIEPIVQRGELAGHPIRAWAFFSTSGYTLTGPPLQPRLGLRADYASGSSHPGSGTSTTFHPLIGPSPLLTDANLNTAANLITLDPSLTLHLGPRWKLALHYAELWRARRQDAFYGRGQVPIIAGNASSARHIGVYQRAVVDYVVNRQWQASLDFTHFQQGAFARAGKTLGGNYLTATINYRF